MKHNNTDSSTFYEAEAALKNYLKKKGKIMTNREAMGILLETARNYSAEALEADDEKCHDAVMEAVFQMQDYRNDVMREED
jgi:hypothetical protein